MREHDREFRAATAFRRPVRQPIEAIELAHPGVPRGPRGAGGLEGLTILHLSDLHFRRFAPRRAFFDALVRALDDLEPDLVVITGDIMDEPGQERDAIRSMRALLPALHARLGTLGILGNHDSPELARQLREHVGEVRWLSNQCATLDADGVPLRVVGLSWPEDPLSALLSVHQENQLAPAFTLTLAHYPSCIVPCADLGLPLVLAGHTHAGQVRVTAQLAPHTSCDLPIHLATGILRLRDTLMAISRGVGEGVIEHLRVNCPWQVPLYTLRSGPLEPLPPERSRVVTQARAW